MDYNYESLLAERFQMVCQSLLARQYPSVQCMPTGMPDGGRDALSVGPNKSALVFQIKYARNPGQINDAAAWVIDAIKPEIKKVKHLQEIGKIERYIVITNMPGSSHLKVGKNDRVQKYLDDNLTIPAQCWWREDLDRRLDDAFDLKLRYPDLMSGTDAFRLIWTLLGAGEDQTRRENALLAYVSYHYEQDRKVKFKEVGLVPSPLFDLFIDVPITAERPYREQIARGYREATLRLARNKARESGPGEIVRIEPHEGIDSSGRMRFDGQNFIVRTANGTKRIIIGATQLLLDPTFAERNPAIILEGAPGQGKSTLSQYLVQVHRSRLLELTDEIAALPKHAADSPIMLPIKLELRDLALWLNGIDPWSARQADMHHAMPTLETAIVAHIQRYSGGVQFSVADLLATLAHTPALIVLDALDEVADLDDRKLVVEEVTAALTRLRSQNSAIRFVITSRPTAIAKSPSFRGENVTHLSLAPITGQLAIEYAVRWARVRTLDAKDTEDLIGALRRRLQSSHIAELAKNTMQLTILLNLISLRGPSLPDKRTDLYDTYFQVFMDRECEKDISVRDNREFLVDLHTYLGYYLHARAEANRSNGRITTSELEGLIQAYIAKQHQSPDRLQVLTSAVDRIFAIVSRVEGMWEFEVQPLQEYFAARYLYDTAPYSPVGRERSGTKPDIFDAIAPNSYWLNVTRFFAGCFSKGELLDLSDRLGSLVSTGASYTRSLAIALVQDWVFTQSTRATDAVLAAIFDKTGLRWAPNVQALSWAGSTQTVQLSFSRNQDAHAVVDLIWNALRDFPRTVGKMDLCRLARMQRVPAYVLEKWKLDLVTTSGIDRLEWLEIGGWLGIVNHISADDHAALINSFDQENRPIAGALVLINGGNFEALPERLIQESMKCLLGREFRMTAIGIEDPITFFLNAQLWIWTIRALSEDDREYLLDPAQNGVVNAAEWADGRNDLLSRQIEDVSVKVRDLLATADKKPVERLSSWIALVESIVEHYGQSMLANEMAVMAGCFRAGRQSGGVRGLFSSDFPLGVRVRYAKSQLNRAVWWHEQASIIETDYDRNLWLLCLYAWASPDVILELIGEIEEQLSLLTEENRASTVEAARRSLTYSPRSRVVLDRKQSASLRNLRDPATICFLYDRIDQTIISDLLLNRVEPTASAAYMGNIILNCVGKSLMAGDISGETALELMVRGYNLGADEGCGLSPRAVRSLSAQLAKAVLADGWNMPSDALMLAQNIVDVGRPNPEPVMRIAERDGWFGADG
jgi:hypothetical protein